MAGWNPPLKSLVSGVNKRTDVLVRKITLETFSKVTQMSPVDKGTFKANWNVSYNTPDFTVTASKTTARADAEVRKVLTMPVGGIAYLCNTLPYAIRLENGWSKAQAPQGMVKIAVAAWPSAVRAALKG